MFNVFALKYLLSLPDLHKSGRGSDSRNTLKSFRVNSFIIPRYIFDNDNPVSHVRICMACDPDGHNNSAGWADLQS